MAQNKRSPYHPDIPLFLILIPFIAAFNYYLTYTNIKLNWFLALTFTLDTLQGYAAWLVVRKIILWLDKKMPFSKGFVKRVLVQTLLTTIIGLFVISFLTELTSIIARGKMAPASFYLYDLFIISIWFFVINAIYIMIHYYYKWQGVAEKAMVENQKLKKGFLVKEGKHEVILSFSEILGFAIENDYVVLHSKNQKLYYLDTPLEKIVSLLPESLFFRLNRQYVIHRDIITGFTKLENGKISVSLIENDAVPQEIPVSRTKAPAFKQWFRTQH